MAPIGGFNDEDLPENFEAPSSADKIEIPEDFSFFINGLEERMEEEIKEYIEKDYSPITGYLSLKAIRTELGPRPFALPPTKSKIRKLLRRINGNLFVLKLRIMALVGLRRERNWPTDHLYPRIETIIRDRATIKEDKGGDK